MAKNAVNALCWCRSVCCSGTADVAAGRTHTAEAALALAWSALEDGAHAEVKPGS